MTSTLDQKQLPVLWLRLGPVKPQRLEDASPEQKLGLHLALNGA
jgi:hypothetical protein